MDFSTDLFLEYKKRPGRAALARLLERHQDAVYTLCRQVLRHPQDAEDACQEILLEVSRQVDAIDEPEKFAGWLYRTALHTALDLKRQRGRRRIREARAVPASAAETSEPAEALHQGLAGLDDTSRTLVVEHYFGRRPLRELAAERGVSEVAVWKRLSSARERLKKVLGSASVAALDGIVKVSAPAGMVPKALGIAGGPAMKIGIKAAIVAPLVLLTGVGTVAYVRRPDPPPPPRMEARQPSAPKSAPPVRIPSPVAAAPVAAQNLPQGRLLRARRPYPFKDPALSHPAAAVHAWNVLGSKLVTLDLDDLTMTKALELMALSTGLTFVPPPGADSEIIPFKVQEVVAYGALQLMLQPRNFGYEILSDGTVRIDAKDKLKGGYEKLGNEHASRVYHLERASADLAGGWDGVARTDGIAKTEQEYASKKIISIQGETTLADEVNRLHERGITVLVEGRRAGVGGNPDPDPMNKPFIQVLAERSIADHLQDLARIHGLVAVTVEGYAYLTPEENIPIYRARGDGPRREHEQLLATLERPVETAGPSELTDFLEAVGRSHGLNVVPTEAAWDSPAKLSLAAGTTLRQALDQLKAQGLRWAARDGNLYILK